MVRLESSAELNNTAPKLYFNSSMVRLELLVSLLLQKAFASFQFLNGAIRMGIFKALKYLIYHFNSSMVRLE